MFLTPYDPNTANFNVTESAITGTVAVIDQTQVEVLGIPVVGVEAPRSVPQVLVQIGGALFRAIYENRINGLTTDELGSGLPTSDLNPIHPATRAELVLSMNLWPLFPDMSAGTNNDYLDGSSDADQLYCAVVDGTYASESPACPELAAWCQALGGTYTAM